ncbi:MAG TPA: diguanylate cyclase [Actinomycetota bacterium]
MTLRTRLSLFFVLIVVVPLAGAIAAVAVFVPKELDQRAIERLRGASVGASTLRTERLERAARDVARIARGLAVAPQAALAARIESARLESGLDFLVLGSLSSMRAPSFEPGLDPVARITAEEPAGVERAAATLPGRGVLYGGWFTDSVYAKRLAVETGVSVALRHGEELLAASSPQAARIAANAPASGAFAFAGQRGVALPIEGNAGALIVMSPSGAGISDVAGILGLIGAVGLLMAAALGVAIAGAIARPLAELAAGAHAMAAGDLSVRVRAGGRDEIARVGAAFNTMAGSVQSYVNELRDSRDELRRTLERLGATLRSTRGMEEMLGALLEAAAATLGAQGGALYRLSPEGELQLTASLGLEAAPATREPAFEAARSGRPLLLPGFGGDDPLGRTVVAAPLHRGTEIVGAIALTSAGIDPFDERDVATLASFAAQASVAIDNVFLREEAEAMARTDALTGIPNRRTLEEVLASEVERGRRYRTITSLLMIDLDLFKRVNDVHGHIEGDRVLIEAVRRMGSVVRREVDVLARYGGEEFVLILPETPPAGALIVAEKIRSAMEATPFPVAGGVRVTASIGVAATIGGALDAEDLLHAADLALYGAKEQGRNRVVVSQTATQGVRS